MKGAWLSAVRRRSFKAAYRLYRYKARLKGEVSGKAVNFKAKVGGYSGSLEWSVWSRTSTRMVPCAPRAPTVLFVVIVRSPREAYKTFPGRHSRAEVQVGLGGARAGGGGSQRRVHMYMLACDISYHTRFAHASTRRYRSARRITRATKGQRGHSRV